MRIKGDLVIRHDIGRVNTPPVTAMRPLVRLHYSRSSELRIPGEIKYFCMSSMCFMLWSAVVLHIVGLAVTKTWPPYIVVW